MPDRSKRPPGEALVDLRRRLALLFAWAWMIRAASSGTTAGAIVPAANPTSHFCQLPHN
jgi:hypothetical protein